MGVSNPDQLNDSDFQKLYNEYLFIRNYDRKFYLSIAKQALAEILIGTTENE